MSMALINHLLQSYGYLAVFLFVALESVGIPLPGETALIAAALYAGSTHRLDIGLIALVAAVAAIAGDNGGYWLGLHGGTRLGRGGGPRGRAGARKTEGGGFPVPPPRRQGRVLRAVHHRPAHLRRVLRRPERDAALPFPGGQRRRRAAVGGRGLL